MIEIPVFQNTSANFNQEIELADQLVQLKIIYNIRNEFFVLHFTDQNGDILPGIKIVPDYLLLWNHMGAIEFEGDLMVNQADDEAGDDITYTNFGNGWNLYYLTAAEVLAWRTAHGF